MEQARDDRQDEINRRIYHSPAVTRAYESDQTLDRAETAALLKYQPAFAGRYVLDLGIGTGRTTHYLAPLARRYVGTDYSPHMVEHAQHGFPTLEIALCDMRDLRRFADGSFDFIMASCNVLDAVSHDDRLRALREWKRVLTPGGVVMFSSHNRRHERASSGPYLVRARNPATQAAFALRFVRGAINHARIRKFRREENEYALYNDLGHDYAALHYYIDREAQTRQLSRAGFTLADVFDHSGRPLASGDEGRTDPSLLYVAISVGTMYETVR